MLFVIFDDLKTSFSVVCENYMTPEEMLKLVENFYEGFSEKEIEEIERIMLDRSNFFSREPNRIHELTHGIDAKNIQDALDLEKSVGKEIL